MFVVKPVRGGGPKAIALPPRDRATLLKWVRARTTPQRQVLRARIVLRAAEGSSTRHMARDLNVHPRTVRLWIERYLEGGLTALQHDASGRGRKSAIPPESVAIIVATLAGSRAPLKPAIAALAARFAVSPSTVHRVWSQHRPRITPPGER